MSKSNVSPRPEGEGWQWIEEFGGGSWVQFPVGQWLDAQAQLRDALRRVLPSASKVLQRVLYGPGYQGPTPTRSTTGVWTSYPG